MKVFGTEVVHNAVGIFGSRTEFENHPGYRMVYIILTVEGRRVTSEKTKLCRVWLNQILGFFLFSFGCLQCSIDHLWRCITAQ